MRARCLIVLTTALFTLPSAKAGTGYRNEIEKFHRETENELKKEDGWLALAGLFWLKEGINTVGAGPGFDVQLTDSFKGEKFGDIGFFEGNAVLKVENGVEATSGGERVSEIVLASDEMGKPVEIQTGSQTFFLIKRGDRFGIRLKDKNNKTRLTFKKLHWFPTDESYKITARFEGFATPQEVLIPNVLGGAFKMNSPGLLQFSLKGKEYSVQPVEEDGDKLLIIFRDKSNLTETYTGGRFLYTDKPMDGQVVLDFNQATNPPCAFTHFATCPLPPRQNDIDVSIEAGEKRHDH